jgi:hypothetical protein
MRSAYRILVRKIKRRRKFDISRSGKMVAQVNNNMGNKN